MPKPLVAIVGRPNVGKSLLFNKLTGQRTAIVVRFQPFWSECRDSNSRPLEPHSIKSTQKGGI